MPRVTLPIRVSILGPHHSYGTVLNMSLPHEMIYTGLKDGGQVGVIYISLGHYNSGTKTADLNPKCFKI